MKNRQYQKLFTIRNRKLEKNLENVINELKIQNKKARESHKLITNYYNIKFQLCNYIKILISK